MLTRKNNKLIVFFFLLLILLASLTSYLYFVRQTEKQKTPRVDTKEVEIPFETIELLMYNEHGEKKNYVIKNNADWEALWTKIYSIPDVTPPPLPNIDFSKYNIIAVFMGMKGSGGYSIEMTKIRKLNSKISVHVQEIEPGPGCIVTEVITYPAHIVKIPLLEGSPNFITTTETKNCPQY